jgi:2'-5' RNA ligase
MNRPEREQAGRERPAARRLFFACWPDDSARQAIAETVRRHAPAGSRAQRPDQWHVTLEFLGDVPEPRLAEALDAGAAAGAAGGPSDITFDRIEYWKRPEVLCLAATEVPQLLARLVDTLRAELKRRDFVAETRPFRAHVTLARKVARPSPSAEIEPLRWPVRDVCLVQSLTERDGSRYVELARWPVG